MTSVNQSSHLSARVYDGTAVTPFYITVDMLEPPTLPLSPPRPQSQTVAGGNRVVAGNVVQLITNEVRIFEKIPFALRIRLQSERLDALHAIGNPQNISPWTIGGDSWIPVVAANIGTRKNNAGTAIAAQLPPDQVLLDGAFDFVSLNDVPANAPAGVVYAVHMKGCTIDPDGQVQVAYDADNAFVDIPCACWGEIDTSITAYPTGAESILP